MISKIADSSSEGHSENLFLLWPSAINTELYQVSNNGGCDFLAR
jgi:hypothetical protein